DDIAFYSQLPHRLTALGIPYLGKPKDFMYPSSWFFDTDHHLQSWARARHTQKILQTIGQAPQKYCPELK
ncbi:MAG: hypothetical protein KGM99_20300, partial [Burkholderiales bacterium]|nr:hypothetical protein [Burkholderiales bacterium]